MTIMVRFRWFDTIKRAPILVLRTSFDFFFTIYVLSLYNLIMVNLFSQFIFTLQLIDFGATLDNILKFEFLGAKLLVQNVFKLVKWLRLGSV